MRRIALCSLVFLSVLLSCLQLQGQTVASDPAALAKNITVEDAALFHAVFDTCDLGVVGDLVTDDLEFYHDQWGRIAASKAEFLHVIQRQCYGWSKPGALRSRRVLDEKSLAIYPIPGFGASETGTHRFYERRADGTEKLVGIAQFTMVWKGRGSDWHLARVVSYAHQDF